jgi:hypothetical protein
MVIFSSKVSAELAGNLMVLALVPPSILTVLFLNKVVVKITLSDMSRLKKRVFHMAKWVPTHVLVQNDTKNKVNSPG